MRGIGPGMLAHPGTSAHTATANSQVPQSRISIVFAPCAESPNVGAFLEDAVTTTVLSRVGESTSHSTRVLRAASFAGWKNEERADTYAAPQQAPPRAVAEASTGPPHQGRASYLRSAETWRIRCGRKTVAR